jgi:hypothetical protein
MRTSSPLQTSILLAFLNSRRHNPLIHNVIIAEMQPRPISLHVHLNRVPIPAKENGLASTDAPTDTQGESSPYRADKQFLRQWEQHLCAHDTRDSASAIDVREALLGQPSARSVIDVELDAPLHEASCNVCEPEVDNAQDRVARESIEDEHRVEPVQ